MAADYTIRFKGETDPSVQRSSDEVAGIVDKASKKIGDAAGKGAAIGGLAGEIMGKGLLKVAEMGQELVTDSARAASDLSESLNVTQLTFGKASASMEGFFSTAATSVGMSNSAAREASAGIGGLLQNMGIGQQEAAGWSQKLITLGADMGSAFNKDPADAVAAIGAGLRGEAEPLRAFNVLLTDSAIKAKAVEMGLYSGKGEIEANAKAQATLALITEQTSRVQGDFANTSDGVANAQRVSAAQTEDLKAKIGEGLLPVQEALLRLVNDMIPALSSFGDGLGATAGWIQQNAEWLTPLAAGLAVVAAGLVTFNILQGISAAGGLVAYLGTLSIATSLMTVKQWLLNAAMGANPIGIVIVALVALGVGLAVAWNQSETFRNIVTGAWDGIKGAAAGVVGWFTGVALPGIQGFLDNVGKGFNGFVAFLGGWATKVKDAVSAPIRWIADNVFNPLMGGLEKVAGVFGIKWNLPRFSSGGIVPNAKGAQQAFDVGGYTGAGGKYEPAGIVHRGEVVWSQEDVGAWGGPAAVDAMRRRRPMRSLTGDLIPGFAGGGIVPNAKGWGGVNSAFLAAAQAWARATGTTWQVTGNGGFRSQADQIRAWNLYQSGRGPLAANPYTGRGGPHQRGVALDLSPRPGENARARGLLGQFGLGLTVKGEPWHVGWLGSGGSPTPGGEGGAAFDPIGMIKDTIGKVAQVTGAGKLGELLNSIPGRLIEGAASMVKKTLGFDSGGWLMPGATSAVNMTGSPEAVLTAPQWQAVQQVIMRDSADRDQIEALVAALWALVGATMKREDFEALLRTIRRPEPAKVEAI